ncbi:MAG: M48 family metallopeptidase [Halorientalis sp.]
MARWARRTLMVCVGASLLVVHGLAAVGAYWVLVTLWAHRPSLPTTALFLAVVVLTSGYLSYRFGTARVLAGLNAREIPRQRAPTLYERLDAATDRMDVATPRLLVAEMALPNAVALGRGKDGAVVVDRRLFRLLSTDELVGILAHELAHLESHDSLVQTLAYTTVRTLVGLASLLLLPALLLVAGVARSFAWMRGRPTRWPETALGRLHRAVYGGVSALLVFLTLAVRAHSRRREFAADERAAEVTGRPLALARALSKIDRVTDPEWGPLAPLYVRGEEDSGLGRLFSTHPETEERVSRLVELARGQR